MTDPKNIEKICFVSKEAESIRADRLIHESLISTHPELSRSRIQKLIEDHLITVDGHSISAKSKIRQGSYIEVCLPPARKISLEPKEAPLQILYEDDDLAIVNKPPGVAVHPAATEKETTLVNILLYHLNNLSGIGGELRPGIVHRLDKDTSGALAVTKNDKTHQALSQLFARHEMDRSYWALCYGSPSELPAQLSTQIGRNPRDRKKMTVLHENGKEAITQFKLLRTFHQNSADAFACWIEARLHTGRTHQVRVHLTHLGHSLLGDPTYGVPRQSQQKWQNLPPIIQDRVSQLPGQALHARTLGLTHPRSGKKISVEAPPPKSFQELLDALTPYGK